jgi:hypothetical protein
MITTSEGVELSDELVTKLRSLRPKAATEVLSRTICPPHLRAVHARHTLPVAHRAIV